MVKKGSIFARLAERWRSGAGVKVEGIREGGEPARASMSRVEARGARDDALLGVPARGGHGDADLRSTRKLSEREDAMVALGGHFQELAGLLRGVHTRMDGNLGRLVETATTLQQLPVLGNQQLDLLRGMSGHMERQTQLGEQIADTMRSLPIMLQNVESALQRAAQTDARTGAAMREFQATMERIHQSMGRMAENSEQQAKATQSLATQREESWQKLAGGLEQAQRDAAQELRAAADEGMQTLRRSSEDQSNRLQKVVEAHAGWNKAVLAVLGVIALGMLTTIVVLMVR